MECFHHLLERKEICVLYADFEYVKNTVVLRVGECNIYRMLHLSEIRIYIR